jgi:phage terminase large subunit GpA-like protein
MTVAFRKALPLVALALAAILAPPARITPTAWAQTNLLVPDGPKSGEKWSARLTPYIAEPLDMLGPQSPVNEIAVMKSAQTGFTTLLIAAIGHAIDLDPCRMMVIQPTDSALAEFNREKLQPAIEQSAALRAKVKPQTSRSGEGSTTYSKKYPGGSLTMAIGSSGADLRSKTIRKMFRDEIDEWPDDLDGQGDPLDLSRSRLDSFLAQGDWKLADVSTPTVKGASKIERRYEDGDRRRWHVPCPHCGDEFVFEYGPNFRHEAAFPFQAHYVAPCCGAILRSGERDALVRKGRWVATDPRPGAYPSYHFDALSSPFVPWDEIAKRAVSSADDPKKLKAFYNLTLGLPFEVRGDAPSHEILLARREDYPRGHIPPRGLLLTAAADVQMRGIWYEVKAWAPNRESWVVEAKYLDGATDSPDAEAFQALKRESEREFPDAYGRLRPLDALGVDSGYHTGAVYAFCRANGRIHPGTGESVVLALKGWDGWNRPPIGTASLVDIDLGGRKVRKGGRVWPVGTWPLKSAFYSDLAKTGIAGGAAEDPAGYCHFGKWQDEAYFRQITAEYLTDDLVRGKKSRVWKIRASQRDNHFLDTSIYNAALAEYLGMSKLTAAEWAALAKERGMPSDALPLFAKPAAPVEAAPADAPKAEKPETVDERFARLMKRNTGSFS